MEGYPTDEPTRRNNPARSEALAPPRRSAARDTSASARNTRPADARAWRRRTRRHDAHSALIARVAHLVADTTQSDGVLQRVVDALYAFLGYPYVAIALFAAADPTTLVLEAVAGKPRNDAPVGSRCLPAPDGGDPSTPSVGTFRSQLAVPISFGGQPLGFLRVDCVAPYVEDDSASLKVVADQIAVAVANARLRTEALRARAQVALLYTASQQIGAAITEKQAIAAYLDCVAGRGRHVCTVVLYQSDRLWRRVSVLIRGRWSPEAGSMLLEQEMPHVPSALDVPLNAGETVTIVDLRRDPRIPAELREFLQCDGRSALALIPLRARGQGVGLVILSSTIPGPQDAGDLQPYEAGAIQLATALDRCRQLALLGKHSRHLAVLQERQRLARDLHDSVTQHLFSLTLLAQTVTPSWRRDPVEGQRRVERVLELGQAALLELRALVTDLHSNAGEPHAAVPPATFPGVERLRRVGLAAVLREYAVVFTHDHLRVDIEVEGYISQEFRYEEALFRIAQEALSNVLKHAQARRVTLRLRTESDATRLSICDDGIGRAAGGAAATGWGGPAGASGGLGARTMRERAGLLGGGFALRDTPGGGTTVEITLPRTDA